MNRKKQNKLMLLLVLLLAVTIGYAAISTTLKIEGEATVNKQNWNIYWGEPTVTQGSKSMTAPTRGADSGEPANTKLTWSVTLDLPGDFYEFTVDAVNAGTIDAMITNIDDTVSPALPVNPDYIKYEITYADGMELALNHLLKKATGNTPTTEKYKVRVYYDENAATRDTINNMSATTTYTFTFGVTYGQATDDAIDIDAPDDFETDQWGTIARALKNDPDAYPLGSSRDITLDLNGNGTVDNNEIFTLRLANSTTPAECSTAGFSQTGCGVVIEFANPITNHRMNMFTGAGTGPGDGNIGGWPTSSMREYLNETIYPLLPKDLRNVIKDTYVVSSHGSRDLDNFITTDKLYLLSYQEMYAANNGSETARSLNRQLDYYEDEEVTESNGAASIKYWHGTQSTQGCWTRSAHLSTDRDWFFTQGGACNWRADNACGVAPAFRIN